MHHSKYTLYNWKHRFLKLVNDNIAIKNVHQHCQQLESNFTTKKFKTILSKKNVFVVSKRQQNTLSPNPENIIDNSNRENIIKKASYKTAFSNGPGLKDFLSESTIDHSCLISDNAPYLSPLDGNKQNVFLEIYGCQMNVNDAEIVSSILIKNNYEITKNIEKANIILLVTCAIREKAEHKIWSRLLHLRNLKKKDPNLKIGLLGCMAERLKHKIVEEEKIVNIVAGPDSYKDLPRLLQTSNDKEVAINVQLSMDETYADVSPVRLNSESKTAFVSIMRGCDNMCTYCIVPFTRGRERSRPMESILNEVQELSDKGIKEITLLGQNVNSYRDLSQSNFYQYTKAKTNLSKGFKTVYKNKEGGSRFSDLLDNVSKINPEMRIRFTSPHPKDFPDEVLGLIAERRNICQQIHLPAQSGSSTVLSRMRRGYTREAYLELVDHIRSILPEVMLSSDFIVGFCDETADEFEQTLSLMNEVDYSSAYLFAYSMREKTTAHRRYTDNVDKTIKLERLQRLVQLYRSKVESLYKRQIGQYQLVLVEGVSKKGAHDLQGRNDGNIKVIIPNTSIPESRDSPSCRLIKSGDYVVVNINYANSQILKGIPMYHSSIRNFNCIYK